MRLGDYNFMLARALWIKRAESPEKNMNLPFAQRSDMKVRMPFTVLLMIMREVNGETGDRRHESTSVFCEPCKLRHSYSLGR